MVELKTIKVTAQTKRKLDSLKLCPSESYEDLIKRLAVEYEEARK